VPLQEERLVVLTLRQGEELCRQFPGGQHLPPEVINPHNPYSTGQRCAVSPT
jgi:hypothetical protein